MKIKEKVAEAILTNVGDFIVKNQQGQRLSVKLEVKLTGEQAAVFMGIVETVAEHADLRNEMIRQIVHAGILHMYDQIMAEKFQEIKTYLSISQMARKGAMEMMMEKGISLGRTDSGAEIWASF